MWKAVDAFKKDNIGVPQFYGKVCHYLMSINKKNGVVRGYGV
jgi:hypothetical protein